ncbi:hypothetical protein [uncultured Rubinisphaera sp.]|uniref:hypothetical protein n=1 Tax=uncultured Rubinisphaera sp. TaxID=1678686 RepID=UPI0030D7F7F8
MNLLNLAPEIQEAILFMPRVEQGSDPVTERELREVVGVENWREQQRLWRKSHTHDVVVANIN